MRRKTSISVDPVLWRQFGAKLRLEGSDYGDAIDRIVREILDAKPMVAAVLAGMRDPHILAVLKALLADELRKIPKGKKRVEGKEGAA